MFSSGELSSDMMSGGEEEESKPLDEYTLEELLAEMKAKNAKDKSMKKEVKTKKEKEPINEMTDTALMLAALATAVGIPAASLTIAKLHDLAKAGKLGKAGEKVAAFLEKAGKASSPKGTGGGTGGVAEANDEANQTETIQELRKELNEVNLLNAKLLYTNKIFKNKSLNEAQKVKVLTAFDKANSVKEAKLVYETLMESLKLKKPSINESMGFASKTIGATKAPIVESNSMVERFKKLAGIN